MKKWLKSMTALMLVVVMVAGTIVPAFAASPVPSTFYATEVFGHKGETFITTKNSVPLRAFPSNDGRVLEKLPQNYPLEAIGLYRTKKGTMWIRVNTPDYPESWVWCGNIKAHTCTMVNLSDYGYYGFRFCNVCGHLEQTNPGAGAVNYESIHIMLAMLSLIPGIGNGFDLADGFVSLTEGDTSGALLSFSSALPLIGYGGNTIKVGRTMEVATGIQDTSFLITRVSDDVVELCMSPSTRLLRKNMNLKYALTLDDRFFDYDGYWLPGRSIAAHHIVAGTAKDAEDAREILRSVGIGINDARNGVYMCMRSDICANSAIHSGKHSAQYYATVNDTLKQAYGSAKATGKQTLREAQTQAVADALDDLARKLMNGELKLN